MADINEAKELKRLGMSGFINQYFPFNPANTVPTYLKLLKIKDPDFDQDTLDGIEASIHEKYDDALKYFDTALDKNKNNFEALLRKAMVLSHLEKNEEALSIYEGLIKSKLNDAYLYSQIGVLHKDDNKSILNFKKALELDPHYERTYLNLYYHLSRLERHEETLEIFDKAINFFSQSAWVYFEHGNSLYRIERYEQAITSFDKAIELDPINSEAYEWRGYSLRKLERYEQAITSFDKAIELDPINVNSYYYAAVCLKDLKRYKAAIRSLKHGLKIDDSNADLHVLTGYCHHMLEEYDEAILHYKKALLLNPNDSITKNNLEIIINKLGL